MHFLALCGSNNTNKLSPQELSLLRSSSFKCSNNTNKLSPQERCTNLQCERCVQIIQINLVLKNNSSRSIFYTSVQIIQINLVLKNQSHEYQNHSKVQIIQINLVLKNYRPYYSIIVLYLQYILSISIIKY